MKEESEGEKKPKLSRKQRIQQRRKQKIENLKGKKKEVTQQLAVAQQSTQSMGKFDKKAHQK